MIRGVISGLSWSSPGSFRWLPSLFGLCGLFEDVVNEEKETCIAGRKQSIAGEWSL